MASLASVNTLVAPSRKGTSSGARAVPARAAPRSASRNVVRRSRNEDGIEEDTPGAQHTGFRKGHTATLMTDRESKVDGRIIGQIFRIIRQC